MFFPRIYTLLARELVEGGFWRRRAQVTPLGYLRDLTAGFAGELFF